MTGMVLLIGPSLLLSIVTSCLLLRHRHPVGGSRWMWIFAGLSALFAGFMLCGYANAVLILSHLKASGKGAVFYSFPVEVWLGRVHAGFLLDALFGLSFWLWGSYLIVKAVVATSPLTLRKGFVIFLATILCFAIVGCAIGASLGTVDPNYYRNLYSNGHTPQFDPVLAGIGLGLEQGFTSGTLFGLASVALVSWWQRRMNHSSDHDLALA